MLKFISANALVKKNLIESGSCISNVTRIHLCCSDSHLCSFFCFQFVIFNTAARENFISIVVYIMSTQYCLLIVLYTMDSISNEKQRFISVLFQLLRHIRLLRISIKSFVKHLCIHSFLFMNICVYFLTQPIVKWASLCLFRCLSILPQLDQIYHHSSDRHQNKVLNALIFMSTASYLSYLKLESTNVQNKIKIIISVVFFLQWKRLSCQSISLAILASHDSSQRETIKLKI